MKKRIIAVIAAALKNVAFAGVVPASPVETGSLAFTSVGDVVVFNVRGKKFPRYSSNKGFAGWIETLEEVGIPTAVAATMLLAPEANWGWLVAEGIERAEELCSTLWGKPDYRPGSNRASLIIHEIKEVRRSVLASGVATTTRSLPAIRRKMFVQGISDRTGINLNIVEKLVASRKVAELDSFMSWAWQNGVYGYEVVNNLGHIPEKTEAPSRVSEPLGVAVKKYISQTSTKPVDLFEETLSWGGIELLGKKEVHEMYLQLLESKEVKVYDTRIEYIYNIEGIKGAEVSPLYEGYMKEMTKDFVLASLIELYPQPVGYEKYVRSSIGSLIFMSKHRERFNTERTDYLPGGRSSTYKQIKFMELISSVNELPNAHKCGWKNFMSHIETANAERLKEFLAQQANGVRPTELHKEIWEKYGQNQFVTPLLTKEGHQDAREKYKNCIETYWPLVVKGGTTTWEATFPGHGDVLVEVAKDEDTQELKLIQVFGPGNSLVPEVYKKIKEWLVGIKHGANLPY